MLLRRPLGLMVNQVAGSLKRNLEISLAYPKLLSKRFSSVFLVQIFLPEMRGEVLHTISRQFPGKQPAQRVQDSQLEAGRKVTIKVFCPDVTFSDTCICAPPLIVLQRPTP